MTQVATHAAMGVQDLLPPPSSRPGSAGPSSRAGSEDSEASGSPAPGSESHLGNGVSTSTARGRGRGASGSHPGRLTQENKTTLRPSLIVMWYLVGNKKGPRWMSMVLWSLCFTCRCCGIWVWLAGLVREVAIVHRAEGPSCKAKERKSTAMYHVKKVLPCLAAWTELGGLWPGCAACHCGSLILTVPEGVKAQCPAGFPAQQLYSGTLSERSCQASAAKRQMPCMEWDLRSQPNNALFCELEGSSSAKQVLSINVHLMTVHGCSSSQEGR